MLGPVLLLLTLSTALNLCIPPMTCRIFNYYIAAVDILSTLLLHTSYVYELILLATNTDAATEATTKEWSSKIFCILFSNQGSKVIYVPLFYISHSEILKWIPQSIQRKSKCTFRRVSYVIAGQQIEFQKCLPMWWQDISC